MGNRRMELGSEYHLDLSEIHEEENNIFRYLSSFPYAIFYDSGRSAIREFVRMLKEDCVILLPEYICESVIRCFPRDRIQFYRIQQDFTIDLKDVRKKMIRQGGVFFLMQYFGKLQPEDTISEVERLAEQNDYIILEDTTHSIFSAAQTIGDYMVCSLRKWMPLSQGGVLYTAYNRIGLPDAMIKKSIDNRRSEGFVLKSLFLNGEGDYNADYRRIFEECEKSLDQQTESYFLSDFNRFVAGCIDVKQLVDQRKVNARRLRALLGTAFPFLMDYGDDECPLGIPLRVPERDRFRQYLMENHIYCAVHWPFDGICSEVRINAVRNARELITLPIDQRYSEEHMKYLADVILKYGGKLSF